MVDVINYLKSVFDILPNMAPDDREAELSTIIEMIDAEMKREDTRTMNRVSKLERENYRLRVLLDTAAEAIAELREHEYRH